MRTATGNSTTCWRSQRTNEKGERPNLKGLITIGSLRLNSNRKLSRSTLHDLPSGATVWPPVQQVNETKRYGKVH